MNEIILTAMFLLIGIIQIIAIVVNLLLINIEGKYCKHCDWWSEFGATFFVVLSFIPIIGIVVPIGFSLDCLRNVIEEIQVINK